MMMSHSKKKRRELSLVSEDINLYEIHVIFTASILSVFFFGCKNKKKFTNQKNKIESPWWYQYIINW